MSDFIQADQFCNAVKDGTHDSPKKTEQGVKLVTSKNIIGGRLDLSSAYFISDNDAIDVNKRSKVDVNDILISMIGTVGEVCLIDTKPNFVIKNVGLLKLDNPIKAKWLYFYLTSKDAQKTIRERLRGTTQQYLPLGELRKLPILLPKNDQHMLNTVSFLSAINDKIQLNTQTNQTLEAIAQALFKSWFVDFDPVRAKAQAISDSKTSDEANLSAMAVICGKDTSELNDTEYKALWEIADAFPSELVENAEFGEVPKGWEISTIGECYDVIMGQSPSGETYNEQGTGTLFYQGRAEFGWRFPTPRLFTTEPKRMAKANDILMSVRAPVGDLNVALENCCIGRGLCALSHKSGSFSFGFYQIKNLKSILDVFNGEGTVFGSINQKDLKSIQVLNPNKKIILIFDKFIYEIDEKIKNNSQENLSLTKIRDELLPKLLSGEIEL